MLNTLQIQIQKIIIEQLDILNRKQTYNMLPQMYHIDITYWCSGFASGKFEKILRAGRAQQEIYNIMKSAVVRVTRSEDFLKFAGCKT